MLTASLQWAMYASIDVVKCVLELANVVAAVITCWDLQMPLKPKLQITAAFSVRLLSVDKTDHLLSREPTG